MNVRDLMTPNPACCSPGTPLGDVAAMMVTYDCGMVPVVDAEGRPVGTVTDRDITCRCVAKNINPLEKAAGDIMSAPCIGTDPSATLDEAADLMESNQLRRLVVLDADGRCAGVISLADISRSQQEEAVGELIREVSRSTGTPTQPGA